MSNNSCFPTGLFQSNFGKGTAVPIKGLQVLLKEKLPSSEIPHQITEGMAKPERNSC